MSFSSRRDQDGDGGNKYSVCRSPRFPDTSGLCSPVRSGLKRRRRKKRAVCRSRKNLSSAEDKQRRRTFVLSSSTKQESSALKTNAQRTKRVFLPAGTRCLIEDLIKCHLSLRKPRLRQTRCVPSTLGGRNHHKKLPRHSQNANKQTRRSGGTFTAKPDGKTKQKKE